jgi:hypothetical protein
MPIAPTLSTGLKGSDSTNPTLSTGDAKLGATLTGVTAGHAIIVVTNAFKFSTASGDLVTGVTIGGSAATLAVRRAESNSGTSHRTETCIWYALNQTSGNKAIAIAVNGPLSINWHGDSWAIATSSALDQTASSWEQGADGTVSVGATSTLAQAVELAIAVATDRYQWGWNSGYADPGNPPSGYTALSGQCADNVNKVGFQSAYKETSSTAGVDASWAPAQTGGDVTAVIATFKVSTVQRRLKVLAGTAMNGKTGITLHAWAGTPKDSVAQEWTGLSAEASGGILYSTGTEPPAAWTTGAIVNAIAYQPSGTKQGTGYVQAIVEEF